MLLENGGDPTGTNSGGMPVLTQVIMKHDEPKALALARLLVDHGAVVTAGAASGSTPLHAAICRQHKQIVEWLLEKGADPNATCKECDPPLCLALEAEDIDSAELLVRRGASLDRTNQAGISVRELMRRSGDPRIRQLAL